MKNRKRLALALISLAAIGLGVFIYGIRIAVMRSSSMEPVIGQNGIVVMSRNVSHPLKKGNVVEVFLPGGGTRTFRIVAGLPGDKYKITESGMHVGHFFYPSTEGASSLYPEKQIEGVVETGHYLIISASPAGVDSRRVGPVGASLIRSLVLYPGNARETQLVAWAVSEK